MKQQDHLGMSGSSSPGSRRSGWISGAILMAFAFTLCGCVSRSALNDQTFAFSMPALPAINVVANNRVLEIRALQIRPPFDGRSLIYRTGEFSYQRDPYAQFLGLPAEELVGQVGETLRRDGDFGGVVQPGSAVRPDTLVEITISLMYADIRKPRSPYAVLAMQVTFIGATNGLGGKVILDRYYSRQIPIGSTSPDAVIKGLNQALVGILAEAASDFRNQGIGKQGYEPKRGDLTQK